MPALEALLSRFAAAHTQPLGMSVDSVYCHANWAHTMGGVSFPLLADFQPKGEVARSYGIYLDGPGIADRATVIIDAGGTVRYVHSVTPAGKRDIGALLEICEEIDAAWEGELPGPASATGLAGDEVLYVRDNCFFSRTALAARTNLHLGGLVVKNVTQDPAAAAELEAAGGKTQAPALTAEGKVIYESADIVKYLAGKALHLT